jgi:hypothetical protein
MDIPAQAMPHPYTGWPGNELEEVLAASLATTASAPSASVQAAQSMGARILEVLARSALWVPLPNGGSPQHPDLDLPAIELDGQAYVPVFSSEQQFQAVVGTHMSFTVAPAVEFARGLPPQLGIAVNPDGVAGIPLPPLAVAELSRAGRPLIDGIPGDEPGGGRVRLFEPDWKDDPVDFLSAAAEEFAAGAAAAVADPLSAPVPPGACTVRSARRCLASIEGDEPVLFVGVELDRIEGDARSVPLAALGRALGRVPVRWPVNLILLDITQDPVAEWMRHRITPFYGQP